MIWRREDYIDLLTFNQCKRPMFTSIWPLLVGLDKEWINQGATNYEINLSVFDFDSVECVECGGNTGVIGGFAAKSVEETKEYIITQDALGRKMKLCKGFATVALPMDYPVKDMDSWMKIKHLYAFSETRINEQAVEYAIKKQNAGAVITASIPGGFDEPRQLLGEEGLCFAYYDQTELIIDIMHTIMDTAYKVLDRISDLVVIDLINVHEDMAGKSGSLVGPDIIGKYIQPYYRKIWDMLSTKGTRIFEQDSDGNMNTVIDSFLNCGLNTMFPNEPAAGMDIVSLRKKYGKRLALRGGIDKHVLRKDRSDIRIELEYKMQPVMREGGVVFALDHRIPNGTPIENFRYYVRTAKEILGIGY